MKTATREKPILFSGPMVRAILDGRKSQTRRIIPERTLWKWTGQDHHIIDLVNAARFKVGDVLWVREAVYYSGEHDNWYYSADRNGVGNKIYSRLCSLYPVLKSGQKRPSIHMPRWACRLFLEVTSVRVERVQDITEKDALAEGCQYGYESGSSPARLHFSDVWDTVNGPGAWHSNPLVWVVGFKRIDRKGVANA